MAKDSLTPEQQKQIKSWLLEKWEDSRCAICRTNDWHIAGDLVSPPLIVGGGMAIGGTTYPQIMCICRNCGNTVYFNSVVMGIQEKDQEEEGKQAAASGGENG